MKTIFITGNSKGLGLALTQRLLAETDDVFIISCSRTKTEDLDGLLQEFPNRLKWYQIDLSEINTLEEKITEILKDIRVDVFIDNAAVLYKSLLVKMKVDSLAYMINVNMVAPMIVSKVVLNNFLKYKTKGCMLHFSSICAHKGFAGLSMIGATKGAIESFSKSIAHEYGRKKIRSNVISIGLLDGGMGTSVNADQRSALVKSANLEQTTDYDSVLSLALLLISEHSNSATGTVFHVNAGVL